MTMRLFSDKNRPTHLGPYPLERLKRVDQLPDLSTVPEFSNTRFQRPESPQNIVNAMDEYQSMLDALRDGLVNKSLSEIPEGLQERTNHLKGFGYFSDASMVGCCELPDQAMLMTPIRNAGIDALAEELRSKQTKTLAAGIDMIMAELKESMEAPPTSIDNHTHAIVFLYEYPRDPEIDEPGYEWIENAQAERACLRASETAVVIANYLRVLGYPARAHSATTSDVHINKLAVAAGLATVEQGELRHPYLENGFGVAVVTTALELACDKPLAALSDQPKSVIQGLAWKLGKGFAKSASNQLMYKKRRFVDGAYPFEKLRRVEKTTTFIDAARVARVPKRADMFARAQFGDMGKKVQDGATGGLYVRKAAPSSAQRRALGALVLIQNGEAADTITGCCSDPQRNAENIKAACYFLGVDAVGLSECPDWAYYSHDALGEPIEAYHPNAISIIIDQGYETMEGASGDDWISVAQSMRAYLRFSLLGGVVAKHIRNLGYSARAHTVMDGEVLQPPLLLLSGLGEVSRIGEVILNPYLGPRLKSGAVTTNMPMTFDKPIDFGLQTFCESCNKCARECPSGAITAGPKTMFNGYEIWKSDSQKCATYRITTEGGAMCGRCMKTCPWNLEGIFSEAPFRSLAMSFPQSAPLLEKLDDAVGNGGLNLTKKWWWDLEVQADGSYRETDKPKNERSLQTDLKLKFEEQTLAVYPANLAPHPYPYPFPMEREKGIQAYQAMVSAKEYQQRLAKGDTTMVHQYQADSGSPVMRVEVSLVEAMTADVRKYEFKSLDGSDLPQWQAGAHLDLVVAPEFLRQYSLSGDPADRSTYQIAVLREEEGKGGSKLLHRIFSEGRKVFIAKPINHFPLDETATKTYLMGGGIGITPMLAMAHRLYAIGADFEMHYSFKSRESAGFLNDLAAMPWRDHVHLHCSEDGTRAQLDEVLAGYQDGWHVYTCGPDVYMQCVIDAATTNGFPDEARHLEYFSVPDVPDVPEYENHEFTLRLAKSGKDVLVRADQSPTEALADAGVTVDVKCADGLCGVCRCGLISGEVEHRDFVLSEKQRETSIILCQSRGAVEAGVVEIDL
ncbi:NAD-binding oxidoreductase [Leucothrix pacifica]|uniref:NAD-binding oxidoreductase n=1 Tax=Leucothrix pacifica TaxID=1247513 RepID=A0A317C492_9GAMM|nr:NAD-binding oxidoreductase [Leucothrix pacifica]